MNSAFRSYSSALLGAMRCFSVLRCAEAAMTAKAYATYMLLPPSGAGGHT